MLDHEIAFSITARGIGPTIGIGQLYEVEPKDTRFADTSLVLSITAPTNDRVYKTGIISDDSAAGFSIANSNRATAQTIDIYLFYGGLYGLAGSSAASDALGIRSGGPIGAIYVSNTGSDANLGDMVSPLATIREACDRALSLKAYVFGTSGITYSSANILVASGTYAEPAACNLTIYGNGVTDPIIEGKLTLFGSGFAAIHDAEVSDLELRGTTSAFDILASHVSMFGTSNIYNARIVGDGSAPCITAAGGDAPTIHANEIQGCTTGIEVTNGSTPDGGVVINGNLITGNGAGIVSHATGELQVFNNTIRENGIGISFAQAPSGDFSINDNRLICNTEVDVSAAAPVVVGTNAWDYLPPRSMASLPAGDDIDGPVTVTDGTWAYERCSDAVVPCQDTLTTNSKQLEWIGGTVGLADEHSPIPACTTATYQPGSIHATAVITSDEMSPFPPDAEAGSRRLTFTVNGTPASHPPKLRVGIGHRPAVAGATVPMVLTRNNRWVANTTASDFGLLSRIEITDNGDGSVTVPGDLAYITFMVGLHRPREVLPAYDQARNVTDFAITDTQDANDYDPSWYYGPDASRSITVNEEKDQLDGTARRLELSDTIASCDGISAQDELDAFEWHCVEQAGEPVMLFGELRSRTGLSALINFTSPPTQKEDKVVVRRDGEIVHETPYERFYDFNAIQEWSTPNTAIPLTNGGGYRLWTVNQDMALPAASARYRNIVLVKPGATLTHSTATTDALVTVYPDGMFEGRIGLASATQNGLNVTGPLARNVSVAGAGNRGIELDSGGWLRGCSVEGASNGIYAVSENDVRIEDCQIANTVTGIQRTPSSLRATLRDVIISNVSGTAVTLGERAIVSGLTVAGAGTGVVAGGLSIIQNVSVVDVAGTAFSLSGQSTRVDDLVTWSSGVGIDVTATGGSTFHDVISVHNAAAGLRITAAPSSPHAFGGELLIADNGPPFTGDTCESESAADCVISVAGTGVAAGAGGECIAEISTQPINTLEVVDFAADQLFSPAWFDPSHPDAPLGSAVYDEISTFFGFESKYSAFARAGSTSGVDCADLGSCATGETCVSIDLTPPATSPLYRPALPAPAAIDTHSWHYGVQSGCAALYGTWVAENDRGCESYILFGARERLSDHHGNDNGLCEANERCDITSSFGGFAGVGDSSAILGEGPSGIVFYDSQL